MIRRPPRSTLFPYTDALPISAAQGGLPSLCRREGRLDDDARWRDRKSTRLNSSHGYISYAVFCLKKKNKTLRPKLALLTQQQTQAQNTRDEHSARAAA